jgi:2-dehydropantoate 2-reductase
MLPPLPWDLMAVALRSRFARLQLPVHASLDCCKRGLTRLIQAGQVKVEQESMMRTLFVGAGATGGYFGGRLAQAGRDVTFLVRDARARQLRQDGLRIISPHGDVALAPHVLTASEVAAPFDVVFLAVKAYALGDALSDLALAIGPETMVVPLLNGMRHMDILVERFGKGVVIGGVCVVAATLDNEGRIVQLAEMQELSYGEPSGSRSARVAALDTEMRGAGFKARASDRILQEMWEKWVLLASLGGANCLMGGTVGEIEAVPGGTEFMLQFLAECTAVAAASGYPPGEPFLARAKASLTARGSNLASSMYRDMRQNGPVEVEHILGDLLERAHRLGVAAPLLTIAVAHLRIYQNQSRRRQ